MYSRCCEFKRFCLTRCTTSLVCNSLKQDIVCKMNAVTTPPTRQVTHTESIGQTYAQYYFMHFVAHECRLTRKTNGFSNLHLLFRRTGLGRRGGCTGACRGSRVAGGNVNSWACQFSGQTNSYRPVSRCGNVESS